MSIQFHATITRSRFNSHYNKLNFVKTLYKRNIRQAQVLYGEGSDKVKEIWLTKIGDDLCLCVTVLHKLTEHPKSALRLRRTYWLGFDSDRLSIEDEWNWIQIGESPDNAAEFGTTRTVRENKTLDKVPCGLYQAVHLRTDYFRSQLNAWNPLKSSYCKSAIFELAK